MAEFDRASALLLLERLGSADDAEALAAARSLHRSVADAGLTWDAVIARFPADLADDRYAAYDDPDTEVDEDWSLEPTVAVAQAQAEDLPLIERLLASYDLALETRDELLAFKSDIARGEFTAMDRKYLHGLQRRLETRGTG